MLWVEIHPYLIRSPTPCVPEYKLTHDLNIITLLWKFTHDFIIVRLSLCTLWVKIHPWVSHSRLLWQMLWVKFYPWWGFPLSSTKKELQMFLGFIQFLAPFILNLSEKSSVLRNLLKEDVPFMWESNHQASMDKIKQATSGESMLRYFDTAKLPTL